MIDFEIIHYQEVTSTNETLKDLFRDGRAGEGTVILADFQTEGRGRGDNIWFSDPGANLLVSLLLKPDLKASSHFMLNEFVSLSILEALNKFDINAKIKWPNDIYLSGKKLAGILIENVIINGCISSSIVGIGLNIDQGHFPEDIPNAVSLNHFRDLPVKHPELLDILLARLKVNYDLFRAEPLVLHRDYLKHLYLLGETVNYKVNDKDQSGVLTDIKPGGEIVIENDQGQFQTYLFGEIDLISQRRDKP